MIKTSKKCKKCMGKGYIEKAIMMLNEHGISYSKIDPMSIKNICKACKGNGEVKS